MACCSNSIHAQQKRINPEHLRMRCIKCLDGPGRG
jgi:hypothetical protein